MKLLAMAVSAFSILLGSQCMHMKYKPMEDFPQLVEEEKMRIRGKIAEIKEKSNKN